MRNRHGKLRTYEHLALGGAAGALAASVTMPLDYLKTRQQCGAAQSIPSLIRAVVAEHGVQVRVYQRELPSSRRGSLQTTTKMVGK